MLSTSRTSYSSITDVSGWRAASEFAQLDDDKYIYTKWSTNSNSVVFALGNNLAIGRYISTVGYSCSAIAHIECPGINPS